jgi:hypothetical protein
MSPAGLIVMQTHHSMADGAFRIERVKSPWSQELDELENPHRENAHGHLVVVIEIWCAQQLTRADVPLISKLGQTETRRRVDNDVATWCLYRSIFGSFLLVISLHPSCIPRRESNGIISQLTFQPLVARVRRVGMRRSFTRRTPRETH